MARLVALLGLKRSAILSFAVAAGALLLISESRYFVLVLIGSALFGFAISAMVVIDSSIISGHFSQRRQSVCLITGLSDAGGSMIGPAMLGWWLANSMRWGLSWRVGYFAAAADMAALIVWALFVRSSAMRGERSGRDAAGQKVSSHTREILASGALYVAVVLGFCHGLAQAGMLSFVGQLYIIKLHVDAAHAAYFLSGNAAGILSGRLLFGWYRPLEDSGTGGDQHLRGSGDGGIFGGNSLFQLSGRPRHVCHRGNFCFDHWSFFELLPGGQACQGDGHGLFFVCRAVQSGGCLWSFYYRRDRDHLGVGRGILFAPHSAQCSAPWRCFGSFGNGQEAARSK